MDRTTSLLIGGSALALLVVCSGLGGAVFYAVSRRAQEEQAAAQRAREAEARAYEAAERAAEAERQRQVLERARAEAERAMAAAEQETPPGAAASPAGDRRAAVQQAVRGVTSGARRCYERQLADDPGLAVRAQVELTYGLDGAVSGVNVGLGDMPQGPAHDSLERCLEEAFSATRIPAGTEPLTVSVPLVFQSA